MKSTVDCYPGKIQHLKEVKNMNKKEVKRVKSFDSGAIDCIVCNKTLHLYWNGGELDNVECCGILYRTEHQETDLVIYDKKK